MLRTTVLTEADVRTCSIDERPGTEEAFATSLAEALGLTLEGDISLGSLESYLLERAPSEHPLVCLIDNLEHLQLCAPGATAFFERVLVFFARIDTRVLWIGTIGSLAWYFIGKTATAASALATVQPTCLLREASRLLMPVPRAALAWAARHKQA